MHPGSRAAYGSARGQAGVRSMDIPCPFANSRASLRATLSGDSGLPSPRLTGPRIKSNGKSKAVLLCSGFCAQDARALALPVASWHCGDSGRSGPEGGGARDRADSAVAQDVQSAEPER